MSALHRHIARGVLGIVALALALVGARYSPWSLALLVVAVVMFRGCPTCWVMGLVDEMRGQPNRCADGSCSTRPQ